MAVGLRAVMSGWTVDERQVPLLCLLEANSSRGRQFVLSQFLSGFRGSLHLRSLSAMEDTAVMACEKRRRLAWRTLFLATGGKSGQP